MGVDKKANDGKIKVVVVGSGTLGFAQELEKLLQDDFDVSHNETMLICPEPLPEPPLDPILRNDLYYKPSRSKKAKRKW